LIQPPDYWPAASAVLLGLMLLSGAVVRFIAGRLVVDPNIPGAGSTAPGRPGLPALLTIGLLLSLGTIVAFVGLLFGNLGLFGGPPSDLTVIAALAWLTGLVGYLAALLSPHSRPSTRRSRKFASAGSTTILGGCAVLSVLLVMLSTGFLAGWYYPATGSFQIEPYPCAFVSGTGSPAYPDGFPPGAHVSLDWAAVNASNVSITFYQAAPNGNTADWQLTEVGASGGAQFTGSGGAMWADARTNLSRPCDNTRVDVSWSYTLRA
jgi:hypothetical protein